MTSPLSRRSAVTTVERTSFGGTYFDALTYNRMFRKYQAYDFGVVSTNMFSSDLGGHLMNKKFTYLTAAENRVYWLPGGISHYSWKLVASPRVEFTFCDLLVGASDQVGKGGEEFEFTLDKGWLHEPVIIKTEADNLPGIRIIGDPVKLSENVYKYRGVIQSSNPNDWIPAEYLQPGRKAIDLATAVPDESNKKFGGQQFSDVHKLQSHIGVVARKATVTDKMIRTEIGCRQERRSLPENYDSDKSIGIGHVWQTTYRNGTGKEIKANTFITALEARLEEKVQMDRENLMQFGRNESTYDVDTNKKQRTAPGWEEMVKDSSVLRHNGSVTLDEIYQYLMNKFITRTPFSERHIKLVSGTGGIAYMQRLLGEEAKIHTVMDTHFIRERKDGGSGFHKHELEYGSQFTKWLAPNGITVELVYDPTKDDPQLYRTLAPGTSNTKESYCYDIYDFGHTKQAPANASRKDNMVMVREHGVEEYFTVSNVYDPYTGAIKDGSNAYSLNKDASFYRTLDGSLGIFDVSRIGRIQFD